MNNKLDEVAKFAKKNMPTILSIMGSAGVVMTAIASSQAGIKAKDILDKKEEAGERPTGIELVKAIGPTYIPTISLAVGAISCILASNTINGRRNAAMASAYLMAESAYKQYKDKVKETVGTKKEELIRQDIAEDNVKNNPPIDSNVIETGNGDILFSYPIMGDKYFHSSMEWVHRVENEMNSRLLQGDFVTLNELNQLLGLDDMKYFGDSFGWRMDMFSPGEMFSFDIVATQTFEVSPHPCFELDFCRLPSCENYDRKYEWWQL